VWWNEISTVGIWRTAGLSQIPGNPPAASIRTEGSEAADPYRGWISQELPAQIRLKYLTPLNRWTTLTGSPVGSLDEATGGDLGQSLVWREMLADYGVVDAASLVLADQFGCWAFLELWRTRRTLLARALGT
jgi:hypothetical protein